MERIDIENLSIEELRMEFGDCDWMRVFLNEYAVDAVLWLMDRIEELEQHTKGDETMSVEKCGADQVREGQVTQELNDAESAANRLEVRIEEMEKQLSGVLRPDEGAVPCDAKEVERSLVPLASRIRDHHRLLQNLGTRVGEILDRLEIR